MDFQRDGNYFTNKNKITASTYIKGYHIERINKKMEREGKEKVIWSAKPRTEIEISNK